MRKTAMYKKVEPVAAVMAAKIAAGLGPCTVIRQTATEFPDTAMVDLVVAGISCGLSASTIRIQAKKARGGEVSTTGKRVRKTVPYYCKCPVDGSQFLTPEVADKVRAGIAKFKCSRCRKMITVDK